MSQIIPSIHQFEIKPCLLINEPKNLNHASKGFHTEVWMRSTVSLKSKQSTISKYHSRCTNNEAPRGGGGGGPCSLSP